MNGYQIVSEAISYEIKQSKIAGKGIFATTNLQKDVNLGIAFRKVKNTGKPDIDYERTDLGKYVNHSKKPNVKLAMQGKKIIFYVTTKAIRKGEELTLDYQTSPWEGKRDF